MQPPWERGVLGITHALDPSEKALGKVCLLGLFFRTSQLSSGDGYAAHSGAKEEEKLGTKNQHGGGGRPISQSQGAMNTNGRGPI